MPQPEISLSWGHLAELASPRVHLDTPSPAGRPPAHPPDSVHKPELQSEASPHHCVDGDVYDALFGTNGPAPDGECRGVGDTAVCSGLCAVSDTSEDP
jgi:hypothetical protein